MQDGESNNHDRIESSAARGDAAEDEAHDYAIEQTTRAVAEQVYDYDCLGRLTCAQDPPGVCRVYGPDDEPGGIEERAEPQTAALTPSPLPARPSPLPLSRHSPHPLPLSRRERGACRRAA